MKKSSRPTKRHYWILILLAFEVCIGLGCNGDLRVGSPHRNRFVIQSLGLELVQVVGEDSVMNCAIIQPLAQVIPKGRVGLGIKLHIAYQSDSSDGTYNKIGYFAQGADGLKDSISTFRLGVKTGGGEIKWLTDNDLLTPDFDCIDYPSRPTTTFNGASHPYRVCCPFPTISNISGLVRSLNDGGRLPLTSDTPNHEDLIELFLWSKDSLWLPGTAGQSLAFEVEFASGKVLRSK